MVYALWDMESNNLVAERSSLEEALALVRRGIERHGPDFVDDLSLDVASEQGAVSLIAEGRQLAELANDSPPPTRKMG